MATAFSKYGPIETLQTGDVLQRVVQEYDPSAAQTPTTTYADLDGSNYSFTPVSASSKIVYTYQFHIAASSLDWITHVKLLVDGVDETESAITIALEGGTVTGEFNSIYSHLVSSWGTSAKIMKLQVRSYSASFVSRLFETRYMDGAATSVLKRAVLTITEYSA